MPVDDDNGLDSTSSFLLRTTRFLFALSLAIRKDFETSTFHFYSQTSNSELL
jgi:hypothetical protein